MMNIVSDAPSRVPPRATFAVGFVHVLLLALALFAGRAVSDAAQAQEPSAAAMAEARELIKIKGAGQMFDPLVPGVIETAKNTLLRTSPQLSKDLNEVAAALRTEYAARRSEIDEELARAYAKRFTEPELKQVLAFYRTPVGKKMVTEEPQIINDGMQRVQDWADRFSDEVLKRIRAEMAKRGHTL